MELGRDINPSTVCGYNKAYLLELNQKRRAKGDDLSATSLPAKKRGRPLATVRGRARVEDTAVSESDSGVRRSSKYGHCSGCC